MCCWSNIPISNTISSLCLFNLLPYVILLYFTLLQCFDLISSALLCPKPNMLNRTSQYYDDHQTNALSNFTSSWDYPIFREHLISRSRCNIWCSVRAQGSPCRCFVATKLCKNMSFLPSEGAISDCFQPFPLGPLDLQKKTAFRRNAYLKKNADWTSFGLIIFPTVSDRFRPFPTVSFFLND